VHKVEDSHRRSQKEGYGGRTPQYYNAISDGIANNFRVNRHWSLSTPLRTEVVLLG